MTAIKSKRILLSFIFHACLTVSWASYMGSWCPYQVEKIMPCRIRNGSEPYYGPSICWRHENGSYACSKKILYRPKYITTYKKVMETKYKCCPGMVGPQCEKECFNCSSYQRMEDRVAATEKRLSKLEKSLAKDNNNAAGVERLDRFHRDYLNHNHVFSNPSKDISRERSLPLPYVTLNLRIQTILDEFRDMQNRIRLLENEISRLNTQVDDLTLSNNMAYDYSGTNSVGLGGESKKDKSGLPVNKDNPTTTPFIEGSSGKDSNSNTRHQNIDTSSRSASHHHRHSGKVENTFRVLEENLERGDIASTLNDDYGDEVYIDNSTEQYIDQLQLKREHSP